MTSVCAFAQSPERAPASFRPAKPEAEAQAVPSDAAPSRGEDDFGLTGDWGGSRKRLQDSGLGIAIVYKGEGSRVFEGGINRESSYLQNLDLKVLLDTEKMFGWSGTSIFVYGIGDWGGSSRHTPSRNIGDAQGTSNLETATDAMRLYEAWIEKKFAQGKASVLFGVHDLNSEFYVTDSSTLFFNASFGIGKDLSQTGISGPSIFPSPTGAVRLLFRADDHWELRTGVFNAVAGNPDRPADSHHAFTSSDGFLMIQEADYVQDGETHRKIGLGAWGYTRTFDHRSETVTNGAGSAEAKQVGSSGAYLLVDQSLTKALSGFLRVGAASTDSNAVRDNLSGGFVYRSPFASRPDDKVGLAFTRVDPSEEGPAETAYELNYRLELGKGTALQPDLQWIQNPGFDADASSVFTGALRLEIGL